MGIPFDTTTASWQQILTLAPQFGLPPGNFAPSSMYDQAQISAQRNPPPNPSSIKYKGRVYSVTPLCTACLIARGIIYWRTGNVPCSANVTLDLSAQNAEVTGIGNAVLGIASMAGASLPGIGPAINAIESIFKGIIAGHAQAVAMEQNTICQVAGVINKVFAHYDGLVRDGSISVAQAVAGIQSYIAQVNGQLAKISRTNPTNEGTIIQSILSAHADFAHSYYTEIAPASFFTGAPGSAPLGLSGIPGGIVTNVEKIVAAPLQALGIPLTSGELLGLTVLVLLLLIGLVAL